MQSCPPFTTVIAFGSILFCLLLCSQFLIIQTDMYDEAPSKCQGFLLQSSLQYMSCPTYTTDDVLDRATDVMRNICMI